MQSLLYFLPLFFSAVATSAEPWQLAREEQGIEVYQRQADNGEFTVKASLVINSDLSALLVLLNDTRSSNLWIANNQQVKVLARPSYHQAIVHSFFHAPWPVQNRDMITHSYTSQDPDTLVVSIKIEDRGQDYPPKQGYIRMTGVWGFWQLIPLGNGQIKVVYQGSASPLGNIPAWLAKELLVSSTFDSFMGLKSFIPLSKYQNKPLRGIKEP